MSMSDDMENKSIARRESDSSNGEKSTKTDKNLSNEDNSLSSNQGDSEPSVSKKGQNGATTNADNDEKKTSTRKKIATANTVANTAQTAHSVLSLMNLIMMMKMFVANIISAVTSFFSFIGNFIASIFNAAISFISSVASFVSGLVTGAISAISTALSVSASAVVPFFVVGAFAVTGAGAQAVVSKNATNTAQRDTTVRVSCDVKTAPLIQAAVPENTNAMRLNNAKKMYSVLKELGYDNAQIAGAMGNFDHESMGFDPTCIETIYDEPYTLGPRKKAAISAGFDIRKIDSSYAARFPNIKLAGIGLAGYTDTNDGATGNTTLRNYARAHNKNWYDYDLQLAYAFDTEHGYGGGRGGASWMKNTYAKEHYGNAADAATAFAAGYEGNTILGGSERIKYANEWYTQMGEWDVDKTYANSVIEMAHMTMVEGSYDNIGSLFHECSKNKTSYDNSSIASCAVSYAYATVQEGENNNGTQLYQTVHDNVAPGDSHYMSCDRGVACAVRWSGYDDDYPMGNVAVQHSYLKTSSKWKDINWDGRRESLQPGDIIIENNDAHTLMYVGNEAIANKYPQHKDTNYCLVSASFNERSPGCEQWYDCNDRHVFRNTSGKNPNSKYKNAGGK